MSPTPNTLLEMARVLYHLSKKSQHDSIFLDPPLVPRMLFVITKATRPGTTDPPPAVLLLTAALRNASANVDVRSLLADLDGVACMVRVLRAGCSASARPGTARYTAHAASSNAVQRMRTDAGACSTNEHERPEQLDSAAAPADEAADSDATLAVQALGVLRNVAASPQLLHTLASGRAAHALRATLAAHGGNPSVALAAARLFAKLTLDSNIVRAVLADVELLRAVVRAATTFASDSSTASRFAFALGSLTATSEDAGTVGVVRVFVTPLWLPCGCVCLELLCHGVQRCQR